MVKFFNSSDSHLQIIHFSTRLNGILFHNHFDTILNLVVYNIN